MLHITDCSGCWEMAPFGQIQVLRKGARDSKNVLSDTVVLLVTPTTKLHCLPVLWKSGSPERTLLWKAPPSRTRGYVLLCNEGNTRGSWVTVSWQHTPFGSPPLWHRMIWHCRCCQMAFESKGVHLRAIHDSSVPCNTGTKRASGAQRKELSWPEEVRVAFLKSNIRPRSQRVHSSARRGWRWTGVPQA